MKVLLLLQTALLMALPAVPYSYLPESVPFYAYDGVDYTCLFYLPATYFVAVEEEGDDYDRVTYLDLSGYIRHSDSERVEYEPVTKYATTGKVELRKGIASVYLFADPACTTVLSPVTASDNLFLYGESHVEGVYYCRLLGTNGALRGYIGSQGVIVTLPEDNTVAAVAPPADETPEDPGNDDDLYESHLALPVQIILIVSLVVPAFLLVFLLTRKKPKDSGDNPESPRPRR